MRIFSVIIISLMVSSHLFSQTKYDVQFMFEGRSRELIVSVPTKQPPSGGYPVVFMLHGTSGDKNVFYNAKGWKELGQEENFITVFPSSLRWCFFKDGEPVENTRFVCGSVLDSICVEDIPDLIDDVAFLKKIVEVMADTLPVNHAKVFINGFSNGSCMSHKMAMDAGDVFAAAAGSSSGLHELDSITPLKRIPFWYMLGTKDDRYFTPVAPTELPYGGDSILLYLNKQLNRALVCQGLTQNFTKVETAINKTYIWKECRPGEVCAPYIFTINKGQPHQFPNGNNYPVDAPRLFWEFFNNPPETTMSSATKQEILASFVKVYPNPAENTLNIRTGYQYHESWEVFVSDVHGREIKPGQTFYGPDASLDVSNLAAGMYTIRILSGGQNVVKKWVKI